MRVSLVQGSLRSSSKQHGVAALECDDVQREITVVGCACDDCLTLHESEICDFMCNVACNAVGSANRGLDQPNTPRKLCISHKPRTFMIVINVI